MYFVDRQKIEEALQYMEKIMRTFEEHETWTNDFDKLALERIAHLLIEAVLDVGNAMIDGFIMRDPGSYEDIIDILTDEKVISENDGSGLKAVIQHRKMLVQQYAKVDHQQLLDTLKQYFVSLKAYPDAVRTYLQNELGPVSAFRN